MTDPEQPAADIVIPIDVFNCEVAVFTTYEEAIAAARWAGWDEPEGDPNENQASEGQAWWVRSKEGIDYFILYLKKPVRPWVLAHEAYHVAMSIMHTRGIPISFENEEVGAYLVGHMVQYVCEEAAIGLAPKEWVGVEKRHL